MLRQRRPHSRNRLIGVGLSCVAAMYALSTTSAILAGEARTTGIMSLSVVLASDGEQAEHLRFVHEQGLGGLPYVLSTELGMGYRVSRLPYAVLLDRGGIVAAKGLVNSREQLDSLLNAHDMGQPSIQAYLDQNFALTLDGGYHESLSVDVKGYKAGIGLKMYW